MKIPELAFSTINWSDVAPTVHPGETGESFWRSFNNGDLRVRVIEYSAGYKADHWCDRGHVVYILEGEITIELKDGRQFEFQAGMSYQVSDFGDAAHRSFSKNGAKSFIVD